MNNTNSNTWINVREYGAHGVAVKAETLTCPARVHAGWNPNAELRCEIYRAPKNNPFARDTHGLQAALDAAATQGGGTVLVPPGNYLTGPLWLNSNTHLHLEAGANLWGSPELSDYPCDGELDEKILGINQLTGRARDVALINAKGKRNVTISGRGQISAQGGAFFIPWWLGDKSYTLERPWRMFCFQDCEAVSIQDIFIRDSCGWTLVFKDCCHVRVSGIRISNSHGPNVDGIDLENTQYVTISDCDIFTTDDGICLKSTRPGGAVRNVTVSNCNVRTMCNAFKIGTETLGVVEDILFNNCTAYNCDDDLVNMIAAIAVCSCDGARVERIQFHNISARNCKAAFYMFIGKRNKYQAPYREPSIGSLGGVTISNLRATGCIMPSFICGHPDSLVHDVILNNLFIRGHFVCATNPSAIRVPELPDAYPDSLMFGELPCYGIYMRHLNGLNTHNLQVRNSNPADPRPATASTNANNIEETKI